MYISSNGCTWEVWKLRHLKLLRFSRTLQTQIYARYMYKYELFCLLGTWTGQSEWQLVISQGMLVALILLFRLLILLLVCGTMDNVSPD